ncbi:MAG: VCBS repeat-containing protein [Candidatus Solibacter usitatus]|nr:VCBS repeat-containing protein [Candidatus Solibacter usitatus]
MLIRLASWLLCAGALAIPQEPRFIERRIQNLHGEPFAGYALAPGMLTAWGNRVVQWGIPSGKMQVLIPRAAVAFGEGGCLLDSGALVLNEGPPERSLVWLQTRSWKRHVIDTGVDAADTMPATLFGRRGILLIHRGAQVRFYEIPADPTQPWHRTEIYSFYTPSQQGGLGMADVDGDGIPDILAGNDWIKAPASFELPWHLFAIELWNEELSSALLREKLVDLFAAGAQNLVAVQRSLPGARLAWFEKPPDPKQLWIEHRLEGALALDRPNSLQIADFDGDGRLDLLVAERGGTGRLIVFHNAGGGRFEPRTVASGEPVQHAIVTDWNSDGRPDIVTLRKDAISWWQNRR